MDPVGLILEKMQLICSCDPVLTMWQEWEDGEQLCMVECEPEMGLEVVKFSCFV